MIVARLYTQAPAEKGLLQRRVGDIVALPLVLIRTVDQSVVVVKD